MKNTPNSFPSDNHGWAELLSPRKASPALKENRRVPWTVVGAGITGLSAARQLAKLHPNDEIVLLDARRIGQGATARSSGFAVNSSRFGGPFNTDDLEDYLRVNRINEAGLNLLRAQVIENSIECQWREEGFYHTAADTIAIKERGDYLNYLDKLNIAHTPLSKADIAARIGTDYYQCGVFVNQGALVQPAALVYGLAASLPKNVTLYENSPVLEIIDGAPIKLRLENSEIQTDKLILATNYEAGKLGFFARYITGITLSGSFTRKLTDDEVASLGSLNHWGIMSLHTAGATVRLTTDHRIQIRNTGEYHGGALFSETTLKKRQAIHRASFEARFPQLAHLPFEFSWSGVEGKSRNSTNYFGEQRKNIFYAGGYNGSGISRGTAFGTAIADHASGEKSTLINDCKTNAPGVWTPPRPLVDIGALFVTKFQFGGVGKDK